MVKAKIQQGTFGWERGFDPQQLLKLVSEDRNVENGRVSFKGTSKIYWQPVLNSAVRASNVGSLKNRCISASINDASISLRDPDEFLGACARALDRLRKVPKNTFVVYSSLTYQGPNPISVIQDDQVKVVWCSPDANNSFVRKANDAREQLSNIMSGRKVQKDVSRFTTLLSYVTARDFSEAQEQATRSVDRIRGLLNLLVNSSRGVNPFGDLTAPHAINRFRNGPYQTVHKLDGSLAAEMFWYEPRWHHDAESVRFPDPGDYGKAIRKWWMRYRSNPLKEHISDGLLRYCKALDIHDFEPSLIGMWSTLEALTGSHRGDTIVSRIKALFNDHREAEMVANHIRLRRNSHVHAAITPDSKEHDPILVQLNILVSQVLFFCLSEGKKFENVQELFTFLDFSLDQPWLRRQQSLARFFLRYQGR
ncbi:hypothetical protein ACVWYH_000863 [Bradyrhizobium sp. GM24.11]